MSHRYTCVPHILKLHSPPSPAYPHGLFQSTGFECPALCIYKPEWWFSCMKCAIFSISHMSYGCRFFYIKFEICIYVWKSSCIFLVMIDGLLYVSHLDIAALFFLHKYGMLYISHRKIWAYIFQNKVWNIMHFLMKISVKIFGHEVYNSP